MQFGIYYYPWYNKTRWAGEPRVCTSTLGEYDSTDPEIVIRHMDLIISCGFDYVIFELVPVDDWCFETVDKSIEIAIQHLRSKGIKWSFLMDAFVVADHEKEAESMSALVRHIEARGWSEGLVVGKSGLPLLFVFFPVPSHAARIQACHGTDYELRFPAYFPNWGKIDEESDIFQSSPWDQCIDYVREQKGPSIFEALTSLGYISFFESTEKRNNFDGFASVIPSYDDRHLNRDTSFIPELPFISPDRGATLRSYFEKALATRPDHVIVYGWNEYFEAATIEPTEQYGMAHVEICTEIISAAKSSK